MEAHDITLLTVSVSVCLSPSVCVSPNNFLGIWDHFIVCVFPVIFWLYTRSVSYWKVLLDYFFPELLVFNYYVGPNCQHLSLPLSLCLLVPLDYIFMFTFRLRYVWAPVFFVGA
jgi:hypothetical protein